MKSKISSLRTVAVTIAIFAALGIPAQAGVIFTETFDSYSSGSYLYSSSWYASWQGNGVVPYTTPPFFTNSNLVPIANGTWGNARIFQDNGGTGTTPDVTLFPGAGVATFANLNYVSLGTTSAYSGNYTATFVASMQDATPADPFQILSGAFMELNLRQSSTTATDGLSARIYNDGSISVWEGAVSGGPAFSLGLGLSGIGTTAPFTLSVADNGTSLDFNVNGSSVLNFSSSYGSANAGYITFGAGNSGYQGIKYDSVAMAVPEPSTWLMLAFSATTVVVFRRRRRH